MKPAPAVGKPGNRVGSHRTRLLQAIVTMRFALFFLLGPIVGFVVLLLTFGATPGLVGLAMAMMLFSFGLAGILVGAEYQKRAGRLRR